MVYILLEIEPLPALLYIIKSDVPLLRSADAFFLVKVSKFFHSVSSHRDLDLMELKVKGKFVTSSKVKFFHNTSCHILEKINENYDKK